MTNTRANTQGIYFNAQNREIMAVRRESTAPGVPWTKFADDHELGLLGARRELERLGLTDDARSVEWHGMSAPEPGQLRGVSDLIREFQDDSERQRREAESKQEFWKRLVSIFKAPVPSRGEEA